LEASALTHAARVPAIAGRSPLLRLQSDEKLVALIRRGHHGAFEALVHRYQPRLLAFCRHMLGSQEDAEDVLQEVFAASFNAIIADERPIKARPWLYRIARNRCLNHLRRPQPAGQDSMDVFERDAGATTADTVHRREEFRRIMADVRDLPETQRTALLLREIDALSYDQIAEAMETTVPSVKSLLVRARVSLAEAAEARLLTCDEVRLELGQVAEGLTKSSAPVRRHLKCCDRCRTFRGELRKTTRALAAVYPLGPLVFLKKLSLAKLGLGGAASGAASGGGGAAAGGAAAGGLAGTAATAAGTAATAASGITAGGAVSAGAGAIASKAAAGMAAAVIVTAGAVEVKHVRARDAAPAPQVATAPVVRHAPVAAHPKPKPQPEPPKHKAPAKPEPEETAVTIPAPPPPAPVVTVPTEPPAEATIQEEEDSTTLPPPEDREQTDSGEAGATTEPTTPPGESETAPEQLPPAPPAGEPDSGSQPLQP
jgi:RNA polymerase sigma factor (sigma-70 family)